MFFVEARYHHNPKRAADQVRYIAHREEGLRDGQRRELYGIGPRYRALRGDERAIRGSRELRVTQVLPVAGVDVVHSGRNGFTQHGQRGVPILRRSEYAGARQVHGPVAEAPYP